MSKLLKYLLISVVLGLLGSYLGYNGTFKEGTIYFDQSYCSQVIEGHVYVQDDMCVYEGEYRRPLFNGAFEIRIANGTRFVFHNEPSWIAISPKKGK